MAWLELRINSSRDLAPAIEDALLAAGAVSVTLQDNADEPIFEPALGETPLWDATCVIGLFEDGVDPDHIERLLPAPQRSQCQWQTVEDRDWEREWMKDFSPIDCGNNLWICPSWTTPPRPDAVNILLDPGLAFGTGTHPTTFLCMQWIGAQSLAGRAVIDYGCGSGILAVAAVRLGSRQVAAVDIDPQALLATRENAERNDLEPDALNVFMPDQLPRRPADIVMANILAGPLVSLAPQLSDLVVTGGSLCLSGILEVQAATVMQAYADRFRFDTPTVLDGWVRLTAEKFQ